MVLVGLHVLSGCVCACAPVSNGLWVSGNRHGGDGSSNGSGVWMPSTRVFIPLCVQSVYLVTSMFLLLAGMTFQSGVFSESSGSHYALTYLVT